VEVVFRGPPFSFFLIICSPNVGKQFEKCEVAPVFALRVPPHGNFAQGSLFRDCSEKVITGYG
jgi:hypothetical protein